MATNISTNSAAYKRWQQKANALAHDDPGKFRIMMSLVDDEFAGEQMRKRILNLHRTMTREGRERTYGLASKRLGLASKRVDLSAKAYKSELALQGKSTKFAKKSMKEAKTLGYLGLPVSALSGYTKYKADVDEAADIRNLRRRVYGEDDVSGGFESSDPNIGLSQEEMTKVDPELFNLKRKRNRFSARLR